MEKATAQTEQQMPGQPGLASLLAHKEAPYWLSKFNTTIVIKMEFENAIHKGHLYLLWVLQISSVHVSNKGKQKDGEDARFEKMDEL